MVELKDDTDLMSIARDAFINESGAALITKYADLNDELFTESGYRSYAGDLLERMTNPFLDDSIDRAARDPQRKLSANDRIFGTMQLALDYGIEPVNMAKGAAAGILYLLEDIKGEGAEEGSCIGVGKKVDSAQLRKLLQQYSNGWDKDFHERLLNLTSDCFMLH